MARTLRPASLRKPSVRMITTSLAKIVRAKVKRPAIADRAYVKKSSIPTAIRRQVWITFAGEVYRTKCYIPWCQNNMTVFDFHVGHDTPESLGGATEVSNLRPICPQCNLSMSNTYTIQEWSKLSKPASRTWVSFFQQCLYKQRTNK